jgi:cytochrome P450
MTRPVPTDFARLSLRHVWSDLPRIRSTYLRTIEKLRARHGDALEVRLGSKTFKLIYHPEHVRRLLREQSESFRKSDNYSILKTFIGESVFAADGAEWQRLRRQVNPEFTPARVDAFQELVLDKIDARLERWGRAPRFDIGDEMNRLVLSIAASAFFGFEDESDAETVEKALDMGGRATVTKVLFPWLAKVWKKPDRDIERSSRQLDAVLGRMLRAREGAPDRERIDLLSRLIASRAEGNFSERTIRDQAMAVFLAGHETTGLALTWAWHLISLHPEVAARATEEVRSVLGSRRPGLEDMRRLPYLDQVIQESLRVFPTVTTMSRNALEDLRLGELPIAKGDFVQTSAWVVHRHPDFWDDPERFDPSRFEASRRASIVEGSYFPFGLGHRKCVGDGFALMEMRAVLARILQGYGVLASEHPRRLAPVPTLTLRTHGEVRVAFEARS